MALCSINTPLGVLEIKSDMDGNLVRLDFVSEAKSPDEEPENLKDVCKQLIEYLESRRRSFEIPIRLHGTPFQQKVWQQLLTVPYGETSSYGTIAKEIGQPGAAQAVGQAVGANPIGIIVPCHRILASGGKLGGFTGGLDRKKSLLLLEGINGLWD